MKSRFLWFPFLALVAALLAGCSTDGNDDLPPVILSIVDVSMPATAPARQPFTYTATVRITNTRHQFVRFTLLRGTSPYTVMAVGVQDGPGGAETRNEDHTGTLTIGTPGTHEITFLNGSGDLKKTITIQ